MRKIYTLLLLGLFSVQVFSQIPEYCLENEKVHSYLNRGTYPDNDYSFTWIMDYCYSYPWNWKVEGKGVRLDLPKPVPVELDSPLPVVSTLYVSEYEDFGDAYSMTIPAGQVKADVYNLIPGKTYNYKVEYDNGGVMTVAKQGQFKTTGHLRMLKIDGIFNVRDMGGWIGLGGNPIKYGKLIRGSRMNVNGSSTLLITPEGREELRRIGVKADLDLRDAGDAVNATHSFLGEDIPIKNINGAYGSRIATFADKPQSIQGIKQIISWFKEDRPVYFHCSVGADRTGTVAYLIGALCGMSEDALCKEFELTSFSADSITNSRDTPNPERLIRQRTDVGRLDPNDDNDSYKFANMVAKIKSFPGATLQRKVYNHLREGVQGYSISAEDLAFLIKYLTDYSILAGIKCDVDTLNMEVGQTHQLDVKADPLDADHSDPTFKSTSNLIATVDKDGKVTAVGGGQAYIIVNLDGIEKYIPVYVPMTEDDIPSYSVYNKAVGPYLTETQYSADDYTVSTVSKYDTIDMGYGRRDWPAAFRIQWMVCDGVKNQHLTISENPDFSYSVVDVDLADTDSTYRVEDLNPQTVYYYKISGTLYGNSMMLSSSAFKVDGAVKIIKMQEIYNVRDLGGWTGMNGHNVKYGVLFRGSRLREDLANGGKTLTDAVKAIKSAYKLNAEIDLRTADEVSASQSVFGNKVQAKFLKVTNAKDCLGENILSGDAYIKALQSIIDWVKLGKHIYIGSSLGAERAGTMAFLINGLLGVDEDALSKDYELSSFTEDEQAAGREFKRNEGIYPAMVSKIKTLEGGTLQVKIYNYFKNGIGGTSISEDDLKTFICYMLDCTDQELEDALKPKYCLENDIIHNFMNEFTYNDYLDDYEVSFVLDYYDRGKDAGYRLDAPKPINLTWTKAQDAVSQRIEVSEYEDYADAFVYAVPADADSYDVYNLIPGKTYFYRVVSVDGESVETTVGNGSFETTGQIRMILAEGAWNIRDMGGWISGLTGKPVAYGKIYRGGQLKAKGKDSVLLSEEGIEAMRRVGIRAELDLRSRDNCPVDGSALAKPDGNGNDDVDFLLVPESVNARMYHFQNNDANIRELQWIINRLKQDKPVFFHCQNGADRTGTLGFLIGALLGVSEGDLAKDYEMTTFCQEAAVAYDPTEAGFARLRNYTGKLGSPLGGSEDNKEYMFAELANVMKSVAPVNGTYQQKIYNFFRTGVNGTKISAADLSWFIMEMTGYPVLGGINCDVDTLRMEVGGTHQIVATTFPEGAEHSAIKYKSTSNRIVTVSESGLVTAVGPGDAYIIVSVDGIDVYIPVFIPFSDELIPAFSFYNEAVGGYMAETSYSADDYSVSNVSKFDTIDMGYGRRDWPVAFRIDWKLFSGISEQHLYVSASSDFQNCVVDEQLSLMDSTYRIEDLEPLQTYYYKLTGKFPDGVIRTTSSSAFKIESNVRMIKMQNLFNLRDLGGWTGMNGHKVKYGVLFRGSRLRDDLANGGKTFTDDVKALKSAYKLNAEIDLRTADEVSAGQSVFGNKVQAKFLKVPGAKDCLGENILSGDAYIKALQSIIDWVKLGKHIYIGSSLGAERTGTMAFLINGLLGVDEDGLSKDYELSSFTEDEQAAGREFKRNDGIYPAMVSKIKTLEGGTLQAKIYNYFKNGIGGTSISEDDLNTFICYMLDCTEDELKLELKVYDYKYIPVSSKIFDIQGHEVDKTESGFYIIDGQIYYIF